MIPLRFAVVSLGKAYGCYFTIEECWVNEEAANAIEGCLTRRPDGVSGLDREMNGLVQDIPQLSYAFDEDNPKVIHLIDNRLNNQEGYALSAIVQKVDFSGYIGDFVSSLAAEGVLLARSPLTSNEPADVGTTVHASGRNLVVRRALTKFIPLEGRGSIVWIARTRLGVGQSSHIQFYGAPRKGIVAGSFNPALSALLRRSSGSKPGLDGRELVEPLEPTTTIRGAIIH